MRRPTDTALRFLAMLVLIPIYPKMLSTKAIRTKLLAMNTDYDVSVRTIQRDLEKLSAVFPLTDEPRGREKYWCWSDSSAIRQIPAMSQTTALAFKLAAEHLKPLMPPSTHKLLTPYFDHATKILQQTKLGNWPAKIRIINRGPELIVPTIKPGVQEVVYEALLEGKQFEVNYKGKGRGAAKHQVLNPLGLVLRNGIIYLVATAWEYEDPLHYSLHRMNHPRLLDTYVKPLPDFDFARHVEEEGMFSYPVSEKKIKLRALFSPSAALHLTESKLSGDQKITDKKDGRVLVEATVADTAELRWWLLGFGSYVEVLWPKSLREEFAEVAEKMRDIYSADDIHQ